MKRALTMLLIVLVTSSAAHAADFNTWDKRMEITFSGYPSVNDDLTNFPALIILTDGSNEVDFTDFESGGGDLRFTAADASTELNYEIETWDDANSNATIWVQVPLLTNNAVIYAYWGKSSETAPTYTTNGSTWSNGCVAVWHMEQTNATDSTKRGHNGTAQGATASVAGKIGNGNSLTPNNDYIVVPASADLNLSGDYSMSLWVYPRSHTDYEGLLGNHNAANSFLFALYTGQPHALSVYQISSGGWSNSGEPVSENAWHYVGFTRQGTERKFYIDGVNVKTLTIGGAIVGNVNNLHIGNGGPSWTSYGLDGILDEVRIESTKRSSNWIWATYMNMVSNRQFTAYANPVSPDPNRPQISTQPATNVTTTSATLNGTLSSTGTSTTVAFVYWGETDGETNAMQWAHTNTFTTPQSVGPLTTNVTLQTGKEYFYRYAASNDSRQVWAETSEYLLTAGITVSVNPDTIGESGNTATFSFARGQSVTSHTVTVSYTIGGDAINGTDYEPLTQTNITINAGDTNATVQVTTIPDIPIESDEALELTVLGGRNYAVGTPSNAVLTITNEVLVASVGSGFWDVGATWVWGVVPTTNDPVVITNGCTVTIRTNTAITIKSLTIEDAGVLTHSANSTTALGERYKIILDVTDDLTVELGGKIDGDAKGYGPGKQGPGAFVINNSGSSHGGVGAPYSGGGPGLTYGSVTSPTNLGSGCMGTTYGGGGAVILNVEGASTLNGTISANGKYSSNGYNSPGGSVFITTGTLSGNGTISANNGASGVPSGGGRIAIVLTGDGADFSSFSNATVTAYGSGSGVNVAGAGTIYRETKAQAGGQGVVTIDNNNCVGNISITTAIPSYQTWNVPTFALVRGGVLGVPANVTFDLTSKTMTGDGVNKNAGITLQGGTLVTPAAYAFTNYFLRYASTSTFSPTSITIGNNAQFICDRPYTVAGNLTVQSGGDVTHDSNTSTEANKLDLTINGDFTLELGGTVNVNAKGRTSPKSGSHGGKGGPWSSYPDGGYLTYGSITAPTNMARAGRNVGAGGGAAILNVLGASDISGTISAKGGQQSGWSGPGGSVYIRTATLTGSGTISANAYNAAAPAGGGRIAIILTGVGETFSNFSGATLQTYGGYSGAYRGAAGTIYMETQPQGPGHGLLLIKGDGTAPSAVSSTLISGDVTDTVVGSVIITNKAVLAVSNQVLTVQGDWDNKATCVGFENGTVKFVGTNAVTIEGDNTFYNLTCTNAGKVLSFEDGKTNTLNGALTLANVTLDSTSGTASWYLKAAPPPIMNSVSNVTVGRSNADAGYQITAYDSTNSLGNSNWVFAASGVQVNTWEGTASSSWGTSANWSLGRPTIETDNVVIPNGCTYYPLLDDDNRMNSLSLSNGASLNLAGNALTVDEDLRVAGILNATGSELLTLRGDLNFSVGGVFTAATSVVVLDGTNTQTVVSAGNTFNDLTVNSRSAPVVFADAVLASSLVNDSAPLTFGGDVTLSTSLDSQGANIAFGGTVSVPAFQNDDGALVFGGALAATAFYSANGTLIFSGTVATVSFTNWNADATFHDDLTTTTFHCAPGDMTLTFEAGKTVTIGDFDLYGSGGQPIQLRSSAASSWNLNVTNWAKVRHVDVQYSDADLGKTIRPLSSTDSGNNSNWVFDPSWQTWVGGVSAVFDNTNNWIPANAPDSSRRLLIDGYYSTAPILSGVATAAQVVVGGYTSAVLTVNGHLTTVGDVELLVGATLTHSANTTTEANRLFLTIGSNLTLAAGARINVDGKGYTARYGPGPGSHGGVGASYSTYVASPTYGSITAPTHLGSGGYNNSSHGGGAAIITVAGVSDLSGTISAVGQISLGWAAPGGSIYLRTGTITGNPTINASGSHAAGAGGGGRVAIVLTADGANFSSFDTAGLSAYGGSGGAAGTIYTETKTQGAGKGTLLVDANNVASSYRTLIGSNVTDTTVGTVVMTNTARVTLTNNVLTVQGDWHKAASATFSAQADSTVDFAGSEAATINADNTFYNLTAGAAGKTIRFEAGKTTTVNGKLIFVDDTTLLSTADGTQWWLDLSSSTGTQEVGRVTVKDSNASLGLEILAGAGSTDLGNNVNWSFPIGGTLFRFR